MKSPQPLALLLMRGMLYETEPEDSRSEKTPAQKENYHIFSLIDRN
jgi:hypothetical protein